LRRRLRLLTVLGRVSRDVLGRVVTPAYLNETNRVGAASATQRLRVARRWDTRLG
jgi:hypothetical protein